MERRVVVVDDIGAVIEVVCDGESASPKPPARCRRSPDSGTAGSGRSSIWPTGQRGGEDEPTDGGDRRERHARPAPVNDRRCPITQSTRLSDPDPDAIPT